MRYDSTKPEKVLRRHTWRDVMPFTKHETANQEYVYKLSWRIGKNIIDGTAKRKLITGKWTGVGKASVKDKRLNSQIMDRDVRFIDLERLTPTRNTSSSLMRKTGTAQEKRVSEDVEKAFGYVFGYEDVKISSLGSHINKTAYLINYQGSPYSSYNAASGEESLINILIEVIDSPNNSLIIIDELEAGFHPSIQRKIADVLQYISWNDKKQFIITTHSPSLLSAFPQESRKYIDKKENGEYEVINKISVNTAFSKMDSQAHPLIHLYCEDDIAEFIIKQLLIEINKNHQFFDRLINIIKSGPVNQVKNDYERHKRNYDQFKFKIGYACVFDGDYKNDQNYSTYHENPSEFSFFLYPFIAPEKFLIKSYLNNHPNQKLKSALGTIDHHSLFTEMVTLGLASSDENALFICWSSFKSTSEYTELYENFQNFIIKTTKYFSEKSD